MIIKKTRINSLPRYTQGVDDDEDFAVGVRVTEAIEEQLPELGFSDDWTDGETVLPPASAGTTSHKNAEGWEIVHDDQPMETAYREFEWTWKEWHGRYNSVDQSRTVYQPYERYPRTVVPPPGFELQLVPDTPQGRMVVVDATFQKGSDSDDAKLAINLLLELFGEAELLRGDLSTYVHPTIRKVNWEVLPAGKHPWTSIRPEVEGVLADQGPRKRGVYEDRWSFISEFEPSFVAVGRAGFSGYLIFGFDDAGIYVLESAYYGNATYILDEDWETLSTLTKGDLLKDSLHRDRIIHREDWHAEIRKLLDRP